jgi:hypothetical protein
VPREYIPRFVHYWTFHALDEATWELRDRDGVGRARVLLTRRDTRRGPDGFPVPRPRRRVPVVPPDGSTATMRNGLRRFGSRRSRTRGLLELGDRRYVLTHRTARRARVHRDGLWLASSRRNGLALPPWPEIVAHEDLDPVDEVAVALLCRVLRPGRRSTVGLLGDLFDVLGTGSA